MIFGGRMMRRLGLDFGRLFVIRFFFFLDGARIFRAFVARQRADHQVDGAPTSLGLKIGMAERRDVGDEFFDDLEADFGVRHFAATEFERDLDLHVFAQKSRPRDPP